ncbi:hypothetical protein ABPG72_000689 [Tetrahymena utriculariae]
MQNYGSRNQLKPISNQYSQNQSPLSKNTKSMNAIKSQMFTVESYVDRYKHAFKEGNEVKNRDWQGLVKANEYLRECLRDLNFSISKKVEKQKDQIYQKFTSQSASSSLAKKSEEQIIEQQIAVLNQEYKNNSFILIQQEKELKNLDGKLTNVSQNQQFQLMQKIEQLQESIKKERLEIKQNRQFNFLEGKYLDNIVNNNQLPKVVEIQQSKQLDSLKLQNTNQKIREQINKKEEIINEYAKKIQFIDKDYREALQNEKQFKIVDQELLSKIKVQKKKVQQLEDNIELIKHNIDREKMRFDGIKRDLITLIQHTDDKINDIEMKTRQINNDLTELRQVGTEVSPTFQQRFPKEEIKVSYFDERENNQQFSSVQSSKQQSRNIQSSPIKPESSKSKSQKSFVKPDKISSNTNLKPKNVNKSTDDFDYFQKNHPEAHQQKYSESKPNFTQKKHNNGNKDDLDDEVVKSTEKAQQKYQIQDVQKNKSDFGGAQVGEDDIDNSSIKSKHQLTPIKQQQKQSQEAASNTKNQVKNTQIESIEKQVSQKQIQQQQSENHKLIKKQNSDLDEFFDQNQESQHKEQEEKIQPIHDNQQVQKQPVQQEVQKQPAQQEVKKKPQKVDSGMQFDHDSPSNKQHKQEKDMNRLNTENIENQITEIKNSSKEEKAQNLKSIQESINEINNNINKIEQQSVKNDNKSLNSISNQNTAQKNQNVQQNGITKKGDDDIDMDEDLDKIEEEIRRLEEEMQNKEKQTQQKQKQNSEEQIQEKQPSKVELAPIKKSVIQKETSFTQTDQAENKNEIFQYKNKESLLNIKEIHESNQQKSKINMNQQEQNQRNSQVQLNPISSQNQIHQQQNQNPKKSLSHLEPFKQPLKNNNQQKSKMNYDDLDFDDSADLLDDAYSNKNQNNPKSNQNNLKNQSNQHIQANNAQASNTKANYNNQIHNNFKNDDSFDLDLLQDTNVKKQEQKAGQKQNQQQYQAQSNIQQYQNNNNNNKDLDLELFD